MESLTEEQVALQVSDWWERYTKYILYQAKQLMWSEERVKKKLDDKGPVTECWKNRLRQDPKWIPMMRQFPYGGFIRLVPADFLDWKE